MHEIESASSVGVNPSKVRFFRVGNRVWAVSATVLAALSGGPVGFGLALRSVGLGVWNEARFDKLLQEGQAQIEAKSAQPSNS